MEAFRRMYGQLRRLALSASDALPTCACKPLAGLSQSWQQAVLGLSRQHHRYGTLARAVRSVHAVRALATPSTTSPVYSPAPLPTNRKPSYPCDTPLPSVNCSFNGYSSQTVLHRHRESGPAAAISLAAAGRCVGDWTGGQRGMCRSSSSSSGSSSSLLSSAINSSDSSSNGGRGSAASITQTERLLSPALEARLQQLHCRCAQLEALLAGPAAGGVGGGGGGGGGSGSGAGRRDVGREFSRLKPMAAAYERLLRVRQELGDLAALLGDPDPQVRAMAEEEGRELRQQAAALTRRLLLALLPRDSRDGRAALLEVRAGAGGQEAALFCGELLEMYRKFVLARGWTWQMVECTTSEVGGVKHAVAAVADGRAGVNSGSGGGGGGDAGDDGSGDVDDADGENGGGVGVYGTLLPESGVHRVQRVPATETQGRVHTSTAAVVVLPQADEVDLRLRDEDLRVETMRASGAGGQHVNVTDSAVRITHLPSGLSVYCQNERSQHQNRATALRVLRARLYDMEMQKRARELDEQRSSLVASADRSERIRTYNFAQGRVTDHRLHLTLHDLESVLDGGEGLARLMRALRAARQEEALRRLAESDGH